MLECLGRVNYIFDEIEKLEGKHGHLFVEKSPLALTVRFKAPVKKVIEDYSLGTETVEGYDVSGVFKKRTYAHLFIMQTTTAKQISDFLHDLDEYGFEEPTVKAETLAQKVLKPTSKVLSYFPLTGRSYH